MTLNTDDMSEQEMRARAEAVQLGQMKMMAAAIEALISVSPQPDYIQFRLAQVMAEIVKTKAPEPLLDWFPAMQTQGASAMADMFVAACQANMERPVHGS